MLSIFSRCQKPGRDANKVRLPVSSSKAGKNISHVTSFVIKIHNFPKIKKRTYC